MIDPKLLTEENGFVEGELVQIDSSVQRWHGLELYDDDYIGWVVGEYENIDPQYISIINPLTGPAAIWNFAPEWADVLLGSDEGFFRFFRDYEWAKWDGILFDREHDKIFYRPFWARRNK